MKAGFSYPRQRDIKNTPALYATEDVAAADKIVTMVLFSPYIGWKWFIVELDPETNRAFGYTEGAHSEWGYIDLNELKAAMVGGVIPAVEQDVYFTPKKFSEINR